MIVDDLKSVSKGFRELAAGAQVFRVPFPVCPLIHDRDSRLCLKWTGWNELGIMSLIPTNKRKQLVCDFWKPPFEKFIIASEKAERGCLVVHVHKTDGDSYVADEDRLDSATGEVVLHKGLRPEWVAQVGLIGLNDHDRAISLLTLQIWAMEGHLGDVTSLREELTVKTQTILDPELLRTDKEKENLERDLRELWTKYSDSLTRDVAHVTTTFATTCALLCCKNIVTAKEHPPQKLQKARQHRGQLPLVSFHTLRLKLPSRRQQQGSAHNSGHSEPLANHWVRGHFKTFTEEKPLLGRAVGTFWWGPHLAGRADRTVIKEYEIEAS